MKEYVSIRKKDSVKEKIKEIIYFPSNPWCDKNYDNRPILC